MPALLTRMSIAAAERRVASSARRRDAAGEPSRSAATKSARPPAARISLDHLGAALGVAPADDDVRALRGERDGDRAADVAGRAGDERGLALESHRMDYTVQMLTAKGQATRARIVEAAADLVLARGVGGTSLDDIRAGTRTSKSQLFHYFPGGKRELVGAIAALQAERVLDAQRPLPRRPSTRRTWERWRDAVARPLRLAAALGLPDRRADR